MRSFLGHSGPKVDPVSGKRSNKNNELVLNPSKAVKIIENFDNRDRLFLTVSYNAPHFPWIPSDPSNDAYNDTENLTTHR